jgi:hypothetical protein
MTQQAMRGRHGRRNTDPRVPDMEQRQRASRHPAAAWQGATGGAHGGDGCSWGSTASYRSDPKIPDGPLRGQPRLDPGAPGWQCSDSRIRKARLSRPGNRRCASILKRLPPLPAPQTSASCLRFRSSKPPLRSSSGSSRRRLPRWSSSRSPKSNRSPRKSIMKPPPE